MRKFLIRYKYELLLFALFQHLFVGIFLQNLAFYTRYIWPVNIFIVGLASIGVFVQTSMWKRVVRAILFILVLGLPISLPFFYDVPNFFQLLNITYVVFFLFIFWEVMRFLISPSYINADIISASACGYLLLIEISVFLFQYFFYNNSQSIKGINLADNASVFTDLVYYCCVTISSIGFGDITPNTHNTKLLTSLLGICGQFYAVVLVGILISKFSSKNNVTQKEDNG